MRRLLPALALIAAAALGGCNGMGGSLASEPVASAPPPAATANFNLPPGRPCSGEIDHYQALAARDAGTGNLDPSVYRQIESELTRAAAACSAGRDGDATRIVRASQAQHGYRG